MAENSIDEDPAAMTLWSLCIYEGIRDDRLDVYLCHVHYTSDSIWMRLERERRGTLYRWEVLSSVPETSVHPVEVGSRGECDVAEDQPCLED